ncbi:helix-turn-helix domain-containing protein [Clostridium hydrogenum]|uniref:helix-turn-helix domain-containing protein n=1 Tax=Clostridium hydrogenum TaxID=2855764 RepID=UPI001F1A50A1|nr:AraC family transcriptional regulator [Clostridium hydrogenum]
MKSSEMLANAHRLPVLDWNLCFFGGHIQKVQKGWYVPSNSHLAFEMIFIIEGEQKTLIENEIYCMNKGDILIIPPGFVHEITCTGKNGMEYFCAHFDIDDPIFIMEMTQKSKVHYENGSKENELLKKYIYEFINLIDYTMNYSFKTKMQIQMILSNFLLEISTLLEKRVTNTKNSILDSKYAKMIAEKIKASLKEKILYETKGKEEKFGGSEIKIEDIINKVGLSSGYGYKIFKNVYGLSPREYLSKLKLREAEAMLTKPQVSIQEISERLGYKNLADFSRQFKRWKGISPNKYRKEM